MTDIATMLRTPRVRCPYCGSETCRHPSRREEVAFVEWMLDHTGRDVLHVFAREEGDNLVYDCPVCGDRHCHGKAYGSRATHCPVRVPMTVVLMVSQGGPA